MKKGIIHISDLHITEHYNVDGGIINLSWFVAQPTTFKESIISAIRKKNELLKIEEFILIVSGDLSNQSVEEEYKSTTIFLNHLQSELNINISNILIVPGNHDINWLENQIASESGRRNSVNKKSWEYNNEKFKYFKSFYDNFYLNEKFEFIPENNVIHHLAIEESKILIIGLNSVLKSSYIEKKYGDFNLEFLDKELTKLVENFKDYAKIAVFHHNPKINNKNEEPSFKDWANTNVIFNKYGIKTFIFGHEHNYGVTSDDNDFSNYIATGSLGLKNISVSNFINIIEILENDDSVSLKSNFLKLEYTNKPNHPEFGFWNDLNDPSCNQELLLIKREKPITTKTHSPIIPEATIHEQEPFTQNTNEMAGIEVVNSSYSDRIVDFVKQKSIFKSGHFHWSDNAKSHNWLDVPSLLNSRDVSLTCQKAIIELIKNNNIQSNLIIGVGMEGCFLGSIVSLHLDLPFTFVPYEYRYKDHDSYETKLNHNSVKNVTIITDVVHSGNTIKRLLDYEKTFFESAEVINLISLFYTGSGKKEYKINMFQKDVNTKLHYYNVCDKLRVESCPYGNDFATKCIVYSKKLDNVYEFYTKERKSDPQS